MNSAGCISLDTSLNLSRRELRKYLTVTNANARWRRRTNSYTLFPTFLLFLQELT